MRSSGATTRSDATTTTVTHTRRNIKFSIRACALAAAAATVATVATHQK